MYTVCILAKASGGQVLRKRKHHLVLNMLSYILSSPVLSIIGHPALIRAVIVTCAVLYSEYHLSARTSMCQQHCHKSCGLFRKTECIVA